METPVEKEMMSSVDKSKAQQRAATCGQEIADVLNRHQCRVIAYLRPLEFIGQEGNKGLVTAAWGIVPDVTL